MAATSRVSVYLLVEVRAVRVPKRGALRLEDEVDLEGRVYARRRLHRRRERRADRRHRRGPVVVVLRVHTHAAVTCELLREPLRMRDVTISTHLEVHERARHDGGHDHDDDRQRACRDDEGRRTTNREAPRRPARVTEESAPSKPPQTHARARATRLVTVRPTTRKVRRIVIIGRERHTHR